MKRILMMIMLLCVLMEIYPEELQLRKNLELQQSLRTEKLDLENPLKNIKKNDDLLQNLELILEETVKEALQQQESQFMILLANKEKKTKVWRKIAVAESLLIGLTLIIGISLHNL